MSDRLPPYDENAEMACIGSMLMGNYAVIDEIAEVIPTPDAFYVPAHVDLYRLITDMRDNECKIDLVLVISRLTEAGLLDKVGGTPYVVSLAESFAYWSNGPYYAESVARNYRRRRCIQIAAALTDSAYSLSDDPDQAAARASYALDQNIATGQRRVFAAQELLDEFPAQLGGESQRPPVPSHLNGYDDEYGGLARGALFILGARPSCGKSTLALQWCVLAARAGFPSLFVSVEMGRSMMNERLACHIGCKARSVLRTMDRDGVQSVCDVAKKHLDGGHLGVALGVSKMRDIVSIVRAHTRRHKLALVVVDYLQLCRSGRRADRRDLEIADMTADLKSVANETEVAMVVCAQLSRRVDTEGRRPTLSDLRESGAIEQDADIVAFLHRDKMGSKELRKTTDFIVAKYRNGPLHEWELEYDLPVYRMRSARGSDGWGLSGQDQATYGSGLLGPPDAAGSVLRAQSWHPEPKDDSVPF